MLTRSLGATDPSFDIADGSFPYPQTTGESQSAPADAGAPGRGACRAPAPPTARGAAALHPILGRRAYRIAVHRPSPFGCANVGIVTLPVARLERAGDARLQPDDSLSAAAASS